MKSASPGQNDMELVGLLLITLPTPNKKTSTQISKKAIVEAASKSNDQKTRGQTLQQNGEWSRAYRMAEYDRWNKYLDTRTNPTPAEERNCLKGTHSGNEIQDDEV